MKGSEQEDKERGGRGGKEGVMEGEWKGSGHGGEGEGKGKGRGEGLR